MWARTGLGSFTQKGSGQCHRQYQAQTWTSMIGIRVLDTIEAGVGVRQTWTAHWQRDLSGSPEYEETSARSLAILGKANGSGQGLGLGLGLGLGKLSKVNYRS